MRSLPLVLVFQRAFFRKARFHSCRRCFSPSSQESVRACICSKTVLRDGSKHRWLPLYREGDLLAWHVGGTQGHRPIGRPWHASPSKSSALVEVISLSTKNTLPFPHLKMIRSPRPLTIRGLCLCLTTLTLDLILAGRSRPRNERPCSSGSSRGNRSVASLVI